MIMETTPSQTGETALLLTALQFTVEKHLKKLGRESSGGAYVRRPVSIASVLTKVGRVTDVNLLVAAILYNTLEDTPTTHFELSEHFGPEVLRLVQQLSEDRTLSETERMQLQLEHTNLLCPRAKQIRVAEKICSLEDLTSGPSSRWPVERKRGYVSWIVQVVAGCRGVNRPLDDHFDDLLEERREVIERELSGREPGLVWVRNIPPDRSPKTIPAN